MFNYEQTVSTRGKEVNQMINTEFWVDEVERLYREGWELRMAVRFVWLMKLNYELGK